MSLYKAKINIAYDCEDAPCIVVVQAETKACEDIKAVMKRVNALREDFRDMSRDLKATIANYAKIETDGKGNEDATPLMTVFYDEGTFREGGDYRSWVLTDGESIGVLLDAFKALTGTKPDIW